MKKLGKKNNTKLNTIEYYLCTCACSCGCTCPCIDVCEVACGAAYGTLFEIQRDTTTYQSMSYANDTIDTNIYTDNLDYFYNQ